MTPAHPAAPVLATDAPLSIVVNCASGRPDTKAACAAATAVFEAAGRPFTLRWIDAPDRHAALVAEAADEALARGGALIGAGGDGTLNSVAAAAHARGLPFGALAQGTFNLFCRDHGIPLDPAAGARALLRARPTPVQVGRVGDRIFLVNASLGLYPELLEDRERCKARYGRSRAVAFGAGLWTLVRTRGSLRLDVDDDGSRRQLRTPSLFVGNNRLQLDRIGIGDVDPTRDDTLTAVVLRPIGWLALLGLALRGALGRLGESTDVDSFEFRRLAVAPRGQRRVKVATDGEVDWCATPVVFDVSPVPLWLLAPVAEDREAGA